MPFLGAATKQSRRNRLKVFVVYFHFGHYGAPYWTLLQTFLIYAQLQIYLLNFTLSILIAIFFLPNSIYICYVLQKRFLCSHTVWSTLRTVWYDAPRAGFSKIVPRPLSASVTASDRGKNEKFSRSVDKYCPPS